MNDIGILYSVHGTRYHDRIAISIYSLRKHHSDVPVCIMALDAAGEEVASWLLSDRRLRPLTAIRYDAGVGRRNSGYAAKPGLPAAGPFARGVWLDADTVVTGKFFEDLLPRENVDVVFTAFGGWTTLTGRITRRLAGWGDYTPELVAACAARAYPALNTGVYGYRRSADFFQRGWLETTRKHISFICDELAAQLCLPGLGNAARVLDDRYNFSPIYGKAVSDHRVIHFHGDKHLRPEAIGYWWPYYEECLNADIGGIKSWGTTKKPTAERAAG